MNKAIFIFLPGIMLLSGCAVDGSSSVTKARVYDEKRIESCPNLSGTYEGVGYLVPGEKNARALSPTKYFDQIFPITDTENWKKLQEGYRKGSYRSFQNVFIPPDIAEIANVSSGVVRISIGYQDANIGSYVSNYNEIESIRCGAGRISWEGKANIDGKSEWGKNVSYFSYSVYQDADGNLISENRQKVQMNFLFGIPAGTAEYYSSYRFKKKDK